MKKKTVIVFFQYTQKSVETAPVKIEHKKSPIFRQGLEW